MVEAARIAPVFCRDEAVHRALGMEPDANHQGGLGLAPDGLEGLFSHANDVRGFVDHDPGPLDPGVLSQFALNHLGLTDQVDFEGRGKVGQGQSGPLDFHARSVVTPHRIQRDADHLQASSTSIRFLPA